MIQLGEYNTLEITKSTEHGLYLTDEENSEEILLPTKYIPEGVDVGDEVKVFVYKDSEDRPIATTLEPTITLNEFALMTVKSVTKFGVFMDWGLAKDLLVPYSELSKNLEEGDSIVVMLYLDSNTNRLVGTANIKSHLNQYNIQIEEGEEVDIMVFDISDLGAQVIVNDEYLGMVYLNEIFQPIKVGDKMKAYVKKVREDKKLDISLQKAGYEHIDANAEIILNYLKSNDGFVALTDKSDPKEIEDTFQISKKVFKKAIGALYKQRRITIKEDGVYLN
ncbi:MAG: GntR family transcriptional regulator [Saprospiraceae bacterium]|nr:GntR family transcriptional regulator [Saprospiraceae bacterium]